MLDERTAEALRAVRDEASRSGKRASFALHREDSHLMRIGNSSVSLSTSEKLTRLDVRVVEGRREGTHTHVGELSGPEQVRELLGVAVEKTAAAREKSFEPLLEEVEEPVDEQDQFDAGLAGLDPAHKTTVYGRVFETVGRDYVYSGAWSSGSIELFLISTSNDLEVYHRGTDQQFSVVLKHPGKEWELRSEGTGWRAADVTAEQASAELGGLTGLYESRPGRRIEPGSYTVIFGPSAIADLLQMAAFSGFHGRLYEEKRSWTASSTIGEVILGDNITITDDPEDDLTFRHRFDMGGRRRRCYPVVERGAISGFFYDLSTSAKFGRRPTGHDTRSPSLVMACGDGPGDPLVAVSSRKGPVLHVPALHYTNMPNVSEGTFTGSSRFNATLVEDGRTVCPLFSSRVTDDLPRLFRSVSVIAPEAVSVNLSNTYERRAPVAFSVPSYIVAEEVRITDCAESF
ncbi:hypothetical protein JW921_03770 [Candidatus Fermentibacterales bacterium]|nr:hypothetical protein [Candidatus Fermentibacterales bacterium]